MKIYEQSTLLKYTNQLRYEMKMSVNVFGGNEKIGEL